MVREELLLEATGASTLEAIEKTDALMELYYKCLPSEPIGGIIERRNDWPEKVDEEKRKRELDREFKEALS
ncbi:hypothetical protein KAV79_04430 [Candidatus Aerophobetes bacterium]|nr:hypothetical protein [Candidatus Aerophobetes bacterium]